MSISFDIARWIILSTLIIASVMPQWASAQTTEDPWAVPVNLSRSGAATNPTLLVDSDSVMHVVWQDEFANFVYSRFDDGQWSAPQRTSLHRLFGRPSSEATPAPTQTLVFTGTNPLFIAGPGDFIYAVWITQLGKLYASRVLNRTFKNVAAWRDGELLSDSASSFAAAVDAEGKLHVAYLNTVEDISTQAGIYYTRSRRNGVDWTHPVLLYASPYFRSLDSAKTNLTVATGGTADAPLVYIAWDNRSRKQVFLAKSMDEGASWEPAMQVAGPAPSSGSDGPFNIHVGAKENNVVLVWQNGQPEGTCTQFFQSSGDAGATWSGPHPMFEDLSDCAKVNEFVTAPAASPGGMLLLLTNIQKQVFLSAWDGSQWSQPQAQPTLYSFEDPDIYTQVEYDCHRATLSGELLYVVGCDRGGGGDIWVTSRTIKSTTDWFTPPVWSQPEPVTSDSLDVDAVEMVATGDNLIHVFFSQRQASSIFYTRWDGTTWSRFTSVLEVPNGEAGWPAVAAGPGNELFLLARSNTGSLYFSRANSRDAVTPSSWSTPVRLPIVHDGKISPADVAWDAAGTVYIAYSIPVNDERGVYLIHSKDQGKTWSDPLQVFAGAAAGFEVVSSPSLQVSANSQIYMLWKQESIRADGVSQPLSLYFAHSEDGGLSFSKAERVVEAPVGWREIMTDSQGNLHRFWQRLDLRKTLWDQVSSDGGRSWERPQRFPTEGGIAAVTVDTVGRLHLVDVGPSSLTHWLWDGSRWLEDAPARLSLALQNDGPAEMLVASVNINKKMVVILVAPTGASDAAERPLFYLTRTLTMPPGEIAVQETPTQSPPSPSVTPAKTPATALLSPTPPVDSGLATPQSPTGIGGPSDPTSLVAKVLLPVVLLLIGVMGVVYLRAFRGRAR
jgi:hypothetical protein